VIQSRQSDASSRVQSSPVESSPVYKGSPAANWSSLQPTTDPAGAHHQPSLSSPRLCPNGPGSVRPADCRRRSTTAPPEKPACNGRTACPQPREASNPKVGTYVSFKACACARTHNSVLILSVNAARHPALSAVRAAGSGPGRGKTPGRRRTRLPARPRGVCDRRRLCVAHPRAPCRQITRGW
jgi:hypothetical protein